MKKKKDSDTKHSLVGSMGDTEEKAKLHWDDIFAIMIAQFQILLPLAIAGAIILTLVLLFIMKVWLRQ